MNKVFSTARYAHHLLKKNWEALGAVKSNRHFTSILVNYPNINSDIKIEFLEATVFDLWVDIS